MLANIPPPPTSNPDTAFLRLLTVLDTLRTQCPWDKKQTMETLRHLTIEETYELSDAILEGDMQEIKKELGDLMMHLVFYARIGSETNNFDITKTRTLLSLINQTPVIELQNTPLEHWGRVGKRCFDIVFSLVFICILSPLFFIIGLLIFFEDSSGPIIYKNRRIGQNGKLFNCYKFRYLKWQYCIKESYGTENKHDPAIEFEKQLIAKQSIRNGPLYKIQADPRKTKIGTFLEKYSLDELPQFFNVLRGDMSII
mgnify:CR=1 FL=1